jgi:rhodanese-related sulfurtransferase
MIDQMTPAHWLQSNIEQGSLADALLLDVREDWELQTASVRAEGFEVRHIPMGQLPARLSELDPERSIACLCHHGGRSSQVAHFLSQQGFHQVVNIAGGIDAWAVQIDPSLPRY